MKTNKPKLIVMVGNIASGKTTWIRKFLDERLLESINDKTTGGGESWVVVSKDALRTMIGAGRYVFDEEVEPYIHDAFVEIMMVFMNEKLNIIVDETNMDLVTRNLLLQFTGIENGFGYDYEIIACVMPTIFVHKTLQHRCPNGEAGCKSAQIWKKVYRQKAEKFEAPTKAEGFDEVWFPC